jgi:DNA-binding NtrC family response regulator
MEAEVRFRQQDFDAVLLDQVMPRRTGAETFAVLRAIDPQVVVVMCSGFPRQAQVGDLLTDGMFGYLVKPVNRLELAETIARACEERRRRQA